MQYWVNLTFLFLEPILKNPVLTTLHFIKQNPVDALEFAKTRIYYIKKRFFHVMEGICNRSKTC